MPKAALTPEFIAKLPRYIVEHGLEGRRFKVADDQLPEQAQPKRRIKGMVYPGEVPGFFLRVGKTGYAAFYLDYYSPVTGKRCTLKVAKGSADPGYARSLAQEEALKISKGIDPAGEKAQVKAEQKQIRNRTLRAFLENDYRSLVLDHRKSGLATEKRIKAAWKPFLDVDMARLSVNAIDDHRLARKVAGIKETTLNRDRTALFALLNVAVERELVDVNPLAKLKKMKEEDDKRVRYLGQKDQNENFEHGERRRFMQTLDHEDTPPYLRAMALLALNTGLRRGEIFKLRWEDVDLRAGRITVRAKNAKTERTRHVPLTTSTIGMLKAWKARDNIVNIQGTVFPNPETGQPFTTIKKSWAGLLKRAQISDFRLHDCRHDFASRLVMKGVDLYVVRDLLGHSSIQLTERYAHLQPERHHAAVAMLED
jgi:integrase